MDVELFHNKEIEETVLSAILKDELLFTSIEMYNLDLFHFTKHQEVFQVMKEIKKQGQTIDIITVAKTAKDMGKQLSMTYVAELSESAITTMNFEAHVNILVEYKHKRMIYNAVNKIDFSNSTDDIGHTMYKLLDSILVSKVEDKTTQESMFEYLEKLYQPTDDSGIKLGLYTIDNLIGGLKPGQLITIAGYTGMGKSITVSQIIYNMLKANKKVDLFSLEMTREEIFNKFVSNGCGIEFDKIFLGKTSEQEKEKIMKFVSSYLSTKQIEIYEFMDDINKIVSQVKKDKLKGNVDIVFIDLINRVTDSSMNDENRAMFLATITRKLKVLAGKLEIPVVITAQINRKVENRIDKAPTLSDIKESGGIAEDSDYVFGLYRNKDLEDKDKLRELERAGKLNYKAKNADVNPDCIEIHVLKGRSIQGFKAGFYWCPKFQRIGNIKEV